MGTYEALHELRRANPGGGAVLPELRPQPGAHCYAGRAEHSPTAAKTAIDGRTGLRVGHGRFPVRMSRPLRDLRLAADAVVCWLHGYRVSGRLLAESVTVAPPRVSFE